MKLINIPLVLFFIILSLTCLNTRANSNNSDVVIDLVKVNKSERIMYLMSDNQIIKQYQIALGDQPKGHKQQEGDQKTPEGKYTLDYEKENSAYYRSMHISYPSELDKVKAKKQGVDPGGFIMIHGQKNMSGELSSFRKNFDWTNGCIAISNDEMDEFMTLVSVGTTIQIQW
ncbi:MAG: L,D-transpeptidase family protein [Colwellia sp.]|nr:L,D-transpeptidase family protein [Colwellia sp.]